MWPRLAAHSQICVEHPKIDILINHTYMGRGEHEVAIGGNSHGSSDARRARGFLSVNTNRTLAVYIIQEEICILFYLYIFFTLFLNFPIFFSLFIFQKTRR